MNTKRTVTITLNENELRGLIEELDDIGFGADDMTGKKQPDKKWPCLADLFETLAGEL